MVIFPRLTSYPMNFRFPPHLWIGSGVAAGYSNTIGTPYSALVQGHKSLRPVNMNVLLMSISEALDVGRANHRVFSGQCVR